MTYAVYIVTGGVSNGGTTASVRLNIFGEYGDTGERPLFKSRTNREPFKRNQVKKFISLSLFTFVFLLNLCSNFIMNLESVRYEFIY